MRTDVSTLQIELEDVGGTSWWASLLTTLTSQYGNTQLRFVAREGDAQAPRYYGATFACPRTWGTLPPQEQWAPGMTQSLDELRREIEADGWVEAGRGEQPWATRYARGG